MNTPDFSDPRIEEAVQLFNAREFFACHDVLEDFWSELIGPEKPFFQGLIQAAVALFHFQEGNLGGARRMYGSSRAYMSGHGPELAGIQVERFLADMETCFAELCREYSEYPHHVRLDDNLIPCIHRTAISN